MAPRKQITYSQRPNHAARAAHKAGEDKFKTYDTSFIRPKRSKLPLIITIILIIALGGVGIWAAITFLGGSTDNTLAEGESVTITIPEGTGAKEFGRLLQENRVIANSNDFTKRVGELGVDSALKPGTYTFTGPNTLEEVIAQLQAGPGANEESFTIPEGCTIAQTAKRVAEAHDGAITEEEFIAAASNASAYEADFPFVTGAYNNSLEGFLFPKTYPIQDNATADTVIRQMLNQFRIETANLDYASYAQAQGLSVYDVLILASIVEKEAAEENRATVASVFYNRLSIDMPLQSDATTAYTIGADPTPEDLQVDGPYNTYLNNGLPKGPICSPGLSCFEAVCAPEKTSYYYFYFVENADGKMEYYFSETYDEHLVAIAAA